MNPLLVFPDPCPPTLAQTLDFAQLSWRSVSTPERARAEEPDGGWSGAIVTLDQDVDAAWAMCRALNDTARRVRPVLLLLGGSRLADLAGRSELFDDFCVIPFHPREFEQRLAHAQWRAGGVDPAAELVEYASLVLNVETYQATIDGKPLELTHMEYELLKFLASSPGRVFTREVLLSRVWGYDYFGGARTVDVHIRRLRAKLGEPHASLIQTIRSVGYSFGEARRSGL